MNFAWLCIAIHDFLIRKLVALIATLIFRRSRLTGTREKQTAPKINFADPRGKEVDEKEARHLGNGCRVIARVAYKSVFNDKSLKTHGS